MKTYLPPRCRHAVCVPRVKPGPRHVLDLLVQRVEVVLELRDQHRLVRPAAPLAVADVEDDQAVVPVARVHQPVHDVEVVHVARGVGAVGVPLAGAGRLGRVGDVDDVDGAGAVVGDEDVAAVLRVLVDVDRMHAGGDAVGELGDLLRVQRVVRVGDDDAVLAVGRALAGEDHVVAVGVVCMSFTRRMFAMIESTTTGFDGIGDVDRVQAVAALVGAEVGHLAVRVDPDLGRRERGARQAADHRHRPPDVALAHLHRRARRHAAERRRSPCRCRCDRRRSGRRRRAARRPGEKLQVGVRLAIGLPAPSRASTLNATTSPWRTDGFDGVTASASRSSPAPPGRRARPTRPRTDAVSVALPGATPVTMPERSTLATFGRLDCQRIESRVRSFAFEKASAVERERLPRRRSWRRAELSSIRVAGPGTPWNRIEVVSTNGR